MCCKCYSTYAITMEEVKQHWKEKTVIFSSPSTQHATFNSWIWDDASKNEKKELNVITKVGRNNHYNY